MGKTNSGEFVSIKEYIDGDFIKYIKNNSDVCEKGTVCDKAEAFLRESLLFLIFRVLGTHYTTQKLHC